MINLIHSINMSQRTWFLSFLYLTYSGILHGSYQLFHTSISWEIKNIFFKSQYTPPFNCVWPSGLFLFLFWLWGLWDLSSWPGIEPGPQWWKHWIDRKSQGQVIFDKSARDSMQEGSLFNKWYWDRWSSID